MMKLFFYFYLNKGSDSMRGQSLLEKETETNHSDIWKVVNKIFLLTQKKSIRILWHIIKLLRKVDKSCKKWKLV